MNSVLIVAVLLGTVACINAAATPGEYSDIANLLRKFDMSSVQNVALKEDNEDKYDNNDDEDGDAVIEEVKNALINSILQDEGEDGSLLASVMQEDDDQAMARFQIFRKIFRRIKRIARSRLGRFVGRRLRSRFCRSG